MTDSLFFAWIFPRFSSNINLNLHQNTFTYSVTDTRTDKKKPENQPFLHSLLKNGKFPPAIQLVFFSMHFNLSFLYNNLIYYIFNFIWLSLFDRGVRKPSKIHTHTHIHNIRRVVGVWYRVVSENDFKWISWMFSAQNKLRFIEEQHFTRIVWFSFRTEYIRNTYNERTSINRQQQQKKWAKAIFTTVSNNRFCYWHLREKFKWANKHCVYTEHCTQYMWRYICIYIVDTAAAQYISCSLMMPFHISDICKNGEICKWI